ncbi:MAG: carboxypeptidase regulatory-like domain-containing protein, partial [Gemmatimonadetes bacterium]|nr:carboxypeptidase regulatory-like domain-containing protein [Gemmatimonadota bacterium]
MALTSRSPRLAHSAVALVLSALPSLLSAQQPRFGTLQGTILDAIGGHAAAATVELSRVQPEPVVTFAAHPDAKGGYRIDSLPPGEYVLHLSTPLLD